MDRRRRGARERLLDAADELFYAHGIAATGIDAVLHRARASPSTLYAHFRGKDALAAAYLERRHHRWRAAWDEALARTDDPALRLVSVFDALALFRRREGATRGCAFLAAAAELSSDDHPAAEWIKADTSLLRGRLHALALEAGASRADTLVDELVFVYDGTLAAYARNSPDPLATARELARTIVRGHLSDGAAPGGSPGRTPSSP